MIIIDGIVYLTKREAAEALGVTARQVERLLVSGRLSKFEFLGGRIMVLRSELENFKTSSLKMVSASASKSIIAMP